MSEEKPDPKAVKAQRSAAAKRILESDLFIETMAGLHDTFLAAWRNAPEKSNSDLREQLYLLDQVAFKFERLLTLALVQGIDQAKLDLAKIQIASPETRADGGRGTRTP